MAEEITFNPEDPRMIAHLYNQNIRLAAQVQALFSLVGWLYNQYGVSEHDTEDLFEQCTDVQFDEMLGKDPMLDGWWKEKLNSELGDIPGLQL